MPGRAVWVFAVEDTSAQVCWRDLPAGTELRAADATTVVPQEVDGRPGAAVLGPLPAATRLDLLVRRPGEKARRRATFRTLAPPPGELLFRFATVNDLHVGERSFGVLRRLRDGQGVDTYALRCTRAALAGASAWGAQLLVAKGDLTYTGRPEQWQALGPELAGMPVPVLATLGNHDVGRRAVDGRQALAGFGIDVPAGPYHRDVPGLRIVVAHTAIPRAGHGRITPAQRDAVASLVASASGGAFVAMHHYPQRFERPTAYPPGIPASEATPFLAAIAAANPSTFVSSGHSHRHRRHHHGPLVVTEVGAVMHYPGTWAGYAVHEGGIRQVVQRVSSPREIAWTERTRWAAGGAWGVWSPGLLADRCFTYRWPARRPPG